MDGRLTAGKGNREMQKGKGVNRRSRYLAAGVLVLVSAIIAELCLPGAIGCVLAALVLIYV